MRYMSLSHLAEYYDVHPDTLRRRFKEFNIKKDEHFIVIGNTVRFDVVKVHPLLTGEYADDRFESVLNRLLI
ncbi:MAG: hypothetical protein PHO27_00575 [Sulfuricurvum sp.]|nr:hypothetical protein [Sulfuricurvum sp.]